MFLPHKCLVDTIGWDLSYLVLEFAEVDPVKWNLNNQIKYAGRLPNWFWGHEALILVENEK